VQLGAVADGDDVAVVGVRHLVELFDLQV
jgi:hypothetical protein